MGTPNCVTQSMQKIQIPLHVLLSEKCATITAHPSHNNFTGSRFPNGSNANLNAFVTITLSLVLPPLISPNCCSSTALPVLSDFYQTHVCSTSDASTANLLVFAHFPALVLTSEKKKPPSRCHALHSVPAGGYEAPERVS